MLDKKYNTYFGFTADEVAKMAAYYGASDNLNELRDWYDGYRFGDAEIYNPWSVINYFSAGCEAALTGSPPATMMSFPKFWSRLTKISIHS